MCGIITISTHLTQHVVNHVLQLDHWYDWKRGVRHVIKPEKGEACY